MEQREGFLPTILTSTAGAGVTFSSSPSNEHGDENDIGTESQPQPQPQPGPSHSYSQPQPQPQPGPSHSQSQPQPQPQPQSPERYSFPQPHPNPPPLQVQPQARPPTRVPPSPPLPAPPPSAYQPQPQFQPQFQFQPQAQAQERHGILVDPSAYAHTHAPYPYPRPHPHRISSADDPFAAARQASMPSHVGSSRNGGGGGGNGNPNVNVQTPVEWIVPRVASREPIPKTIQERLQPTLDIASIQLTSYTRTAHFSSLALNTAIGLQVLLGAFITGISAAASPRGAQVSTAILGGLSTLVASYLARARGSGEPETSRGRARDLEKFIRNCQSTVLDWGHERPNPDALEPNPKHIELLQQIDEYRAEYDNLIALWNGEKQEELPSKSSV